MPFEDYIDKPVDLKHLIEKLDFTEEDVESAAVEQPKLFLRASRYRVQKMRDKLQRISEYDQIVAKTGSRYREDKDGDGKKKTEGAIKERIQRNDKVHKVRKKMEKAFVLEKFSEGLTEAYRQRLSIIKIIVDARWAEAGTAVRVEKEESAKKQSKRMAKDLRERYRGTEHD